MYPFLISSVSLFSNFKFTFDKRKTLYRTSKRKLENHSLLLFLINYNNKVICTKMTKILVIYRLRKHKPIELIKTSSLEDEKPWRLDFKASEILGKLKMLNFIID